MDWEKFFKRHEDYRFTISFYENQERLTLEEVYQAFKARLKQELVTDVHGTSHYGLLVDKPHGDHET